MVSTAAATASGQAAPAGTTACTRSVTAATGWNPRFVVVVIASRPIRYSLAQQTLRAEHQDEDEDGERPDVLPRPAAERRRRVGGGHDLDHAEGEATEHRPVDVADAAEHRRGEGLETGDEAHPEVHLTEPQAVRQSGDRRQ